MAPSGPELAELSAPTRDMHRALAALGQHLAALDNYNQECETCTDPELRLVLAHHRDAQHQQLAMLLEWVRRRDSRLSTALKQALFKAGPITAQHQFGEDAQ